MNGQAQPAFIATRVMENIKEKAEDLTEDIGQYVETFYKLKVLQATDKVARLASLSVTATMITILVLFFLLFLSIGLGWWLGEALDNMVAGFCIVAGFYGLLSLVVLVLHKNLILPWIRNILIRKAYE